MHLHLNSEYFAPNIADSFLCRQVSDFWHLGGEESTALRQGDYYEFGKLVDRIGSV